MNGWPVSHEPPNRLFGPLQRGRFRHGHGTRTPYAGQVASGVTSGRIVGSGRPFWTKNLLDYSIRRSPNFISHLRPIRCPFPPSRLSLTQTGSSYRITVGHRHYGGPIISHRTHGHPRMRYYQSPLCFRPLILGLRRDPEAQTMTPYASFNATLSPLYRHPRALTP